VDALKVGNGAGEENLDLRSGSAGSLMEYHAAAVGHSVPWVGLGLRPGPVFCSTLCRDSSPSQELPATLCIPDCEVTV
jgi:hypothetical protein